MKTALWPFVTGLFMRAYDKIDIYPPLLYDGKNKSLRGGCNV